MNQQPIGLIFILTVAIATCFHLPLQAQTPDLGGQGRPRDRGDGAASHVILSNLPIFIPYF
ncbi:MAG: hypothetical protein SW833_25355 [Cyanobacteriota bacterium]|nr:hypothetical protein [Cyanobacteriota bacterium]